MNRYGSIRFALVLNSYICHRLSFLVFCVLVIVTDKQRLRGHHRGRSRLRGESALGVSVKPTLEPTKVGKQNTSKLNLWHIYM